MSQLEEADTLVSEPTDGVSDQQENTTPEVDVEAFYNEDSQSEAGEEAPVEEHDEDGEVLEPIAAPTSWKAEDKAGWDELPRNVQETISRRESEREKFLQSKAQEAATVEQRVAAQAQQALAQIAREKAAELNRYAAMFQPQPPNPQLLYTGNAQDALTYQQQDAAYRAGLAQQQQLQQQAQDEAAEAQRIEEQQEQQAKQAEAQQLAQALPDWFDADKGPKLRTELQSIGAALGYPVELMAEARTVDIMALKQAAEWKAKADKFDALNKAKMGAVRAAKQLPRIAKPGSGGAKPAETDPVKLLYPND